MSSQIYPEVIRTRQLEIATRSRRGHDQCEANAAANPPVHGGRRRRRLGVIAALALALASSGGAIAIASGHGASTRVGFTADRAVQQIRLLEARGYVQKSCTVTGTAMFNPRTDRTVTVRS